MMQPGRYCPISYRYAPAAIHGATALTAETLYVIGGLYGNRPALEWILQRAASEPDRVTLVFNGDFNWFNVDAEGYGAVNDAVLRHRATRGNVETEIAGDDAAAGCGCAYPDWVGNDEVERSNRIIARLRETARAAPALRARLAALPRLFAAEVGGLRIGIVHGDAESLSGWGFSQESLRDPEHCDTAGSWFSAAGVRVFASSHTCLPVMQSFETAHGRCLVTNNGAAGMPNFQGIRQGLLTRIARDAAPDALYGTWLDGVRLEALPVAYDHDRFMREFLANWPRDSPAYTSYYRRIVEGPSWRPADAVRVGFVTRKRLVGEA
jgi:hypothetical protein